MVIKRLLVALSLCFVVCGVHAQPQELKVGWIGALTGNSAVIGIDAKGAIESVLKASQKDLLGKNKKITFIIEDDGYEVLKAVKAYDKLVSIDKVKVIFVSTYGAIFTLAPRAERDGVLLIDTLDCNDDIAALPGSVFCLASRTESIGETIYQAIQQQKGKKIAILSEEEAWCNFVSNTVAKELTKAKIEFSVSKVDSAEINFKSYVAKIKGYNPDGVVVIGNDQFGSALAQLKNALPQAKYYSIGSISSPGFKKLAGDAVEGVFVSDYGAKLTPSYAKFQEIFSRHVGRKPFLDLAAAPAYDAATLIVNTFLRTGHTEGVELYKSLLLTPDTVGASGDIHIDPDGAVRSIRERMFVINNGVATEVP